MTIAEIDEIAETEETIERKWYEIPVHIERSTINVLDITSIISEAIKIKNDVWLENSIACYNLKCVVGCLENLSLKEGSVAVLRIGINGESDYESIADKMKEIIYRSHKK